MKIRFSTAVRATTVGTTSRTTTIRGNRVQYIDTLAQCESRNATVFGNGKFTVVHRHIYSKNDIVFGKANKRSFYENMSKFLLASLAVLFFAPFDANILIRHGGGALSTYTRSHVTLHLCCGGYKVGWRTCVIHESRRVVHAHDQQQIWIGRKR